MGHPLKFLWEERAQNLTTYSNFWKQFYRKFPEYREASVTAREFEPMRVEVDYAGDPIEWMDLKTGEVRKAWVFVAGRGPMVSNDEVERPRYGARSQTYRYSGTG